MLSYHCAKLTVQNKWLEPGLLWVFRTKSLLRLWAKLGKDELFLTSNGHKQQKILQMKTLKHYPQVEKNAHWLALAWHKTVFVEQTGPTASQYCQMTCIAGENMLYSEYIVTLMVDRCFVSSTTGSSDNSLSLLELALCNMFRIIAAKFLRNMFSSWRHFKKMRLLKCIQVVLRLLRSNHLDTLIKWLTLRTELMFKVSRFTTYPVYTHQEHMQIIMHRFACWAYYIPMDSPERSFLFSSVWLNIMYLPAFLSCLS